AGKACGFGQHDGVLVAESEEARRLQAEDRDLARRPRRERFERAPRLRSRLFHEPDGKEGAPAAKRAALQDGACDMDAILGRLEDADGRARVLRLEPAVERIDEEHDLAPAALGPGALDKVVGAPARKLALRSEAEQALEEPCPGVRQRWKRPCIRRVAGQVGDGALAQRQRMRLAVMRKKLDLHARHVDAGRALALAALAGDAELECVLHGGLAASAELP